MLLAWTRPPWRPEWDESRLALPAFTNTQLQLTALSTVHLYCTYGQSKLNKAGVKCQQDGVSFILAKKCIWISYARLWARFPQKHTLIWLIGPIEVSVMPFERCSINLKFTNSILGINYFRDILLFLIEGGEDVLVIGLPNLSFTHMVENYQDWAIVNWKHCRF